MLGAAIPPVIFSTEATTGDGIAPLVVAVSLLVVASWVTFRWADRAAVEAQAPDWSELGAAERRETLNHAEVVAGRFLARVHRAGA